MDTTRNFARVSRRMAIALVAGCCALLPMQAGAATPAAATALSCGATVTTSVTLTRDLLNCPVDGLIVGANGINIDLNGHRITGTSGQGPDDPVRCLCGVNDRGGFSRVTVHGGRIENFVIGARFTAAHDIVVRDLITAIFWEDAVFFDHVATGLAENSNMPNSYRAVRAADSRGIIVRNLTAANTQHAGVAFLRTINSVVRDSTFNMGGGDYAVEIVNSSHNLVTHNQIRAAGFDGIVVAGISEVGGIPATDNAIRENDIRNGSTGIELVEVDGTPARNNDVTGNDTLGTSDNGILVDALRSVNGDGFPPFERIVGSGPAGNRIKNNVSDGNALDGVHLDAPLNVIAGNVANRNTGWGIYAYPGNTDGGGNQARGNGQAAQCSGVRCS